MAVCFIINITKPDSVRQSVTFRKLRDICIPEFIKDLTPILNDTDRPLNELVHAYTTGIEVVIDQHAPVQRKSITMSNETKRAMVFRRTETRQTRAQASREGIAANQTYRS